MNVLYDNDKLKHVCECYSDALRFFGGNKSLAISLLARINAMKQAVVILDIINQKQFRFHKLYNLGKQMILRDFLPLMLKIEEISIE